MLYSQYNSSLYQPLRADTEGSCGQPCGRVETFSWKVIRKTINLN